MRKISIFYVLALIFEYLNFSDNIGVAQAYSARNKVGALETLTKISRYTLLKYMFQLS